MLIIRKEQMEAFSQTKFKDFENRLVHRLNGLFPEACAAMQDSTLRKTISDAVEQAASYGIVNESDLCLYIDLMFVFGRDFDRDPDLPWAREILNDTGLKDPSLKTNRLYDAGLEHQHLGQGINDER